MSLCLRYHKNGIIREDSILFQDLISESFDLDFSTLEDGQVIEPKLSGKIIGNAILKSIVNLGLDIQNCVGQGYDGAAVMSSNIVGASSVILEKNPRALYTHCVSHSLNLAVIDASKVQEIRNMMSSIRQVVSFINVSAKRKSVFTAAVNYKLPNHPTNQLKSLCETRWVERHEAIETFIVLLPPIKLTLSQVIFILFVPSYILHYNYFLIFITLCSVFRIYQSHLINNPSLSIPVIRGKEITLALSISVLQQ